MTLTSTSIGEELGLRVADRLPRSALRPLRALYVHSGNLYGGIETTLVAQASQRRACPELELSFALCFKGRLSDELKTTGASVHFLESVRVRQPLTVWRARRALRELLRARSFDVVVTHSVWSQAIFGAVVRAHPLPLVFWMHGALTGRHWLERWAKRMPPRLVICNSRFTAGMTPNIYPRVKAEVIYCPMILPETSTSIDERRKVRAQFKTREDAVVIAQVSRMEHWKGHALLIRALGLLKDTPDWVCWQIGGAQRGSEADYLEQLKQLTVELNISDRVQFLGEHSDVPNLLAASDIHCQPNTGPEPFGLTFIEAMAARLPVVTTAIGGASEIVDESCALIVAPADPQALAASLRRLIEDSPLRAKLGEHGARRARQLCDPLTQMKLLHESLSQVCRS